MNEQQASDLIYRSETSINNLAEIAGKFQEVTDRYLDKSGEGAETPDVVAQGILSRKAQAAFAAVLARLTPAVEEAVEELEAQWEKIERELADAE